MIDPILQPLELDFLVDYVNAYAAEPRIRSGGDHLPYPPLAILAEGTQVARGLVESFEGNPFEPQLVQFANRLHGVFAKSQAAPDQALEAINVVLDESGATPHLSRRGGQTVADWHRKHAGSPSDAAIRALQSACGLALYEWLTGSGSLDRLGVCHAHRCADIYVDGSQAAARRYCSAVCGNRTKVAAYRSRSRRQAHLTSSPNTSTIADTEADETND
jgi:CGNR zinc finger/Putative stress-induced transcription regulator